MDFEDSYDDDERVQSSTKPVRSVAEEPDEDVDAEEVEAAERNFEGEDKNSEDERDEEEAEALMLKQEEGVDLKDFENVEPELKNQFILHICYKNVRMEYYNLPSQSGARDFILVDIDAILQELLSKSHFIDWDEHGGQFLHLTYRLETFVQSLLDRSIRFDIVCFEKAGRAPCDVTAEIQSRPDFTSFKRYNVTVRSEKMNNRYLLARSAMLNHLKTKLNVKCHIFDHWLNDDWKQFLFQSRPAFVVGENDNLLFMYHSFLLNNVPVVCDVTFKGLGAYGFSTELYTDIPAVVMGMVPDAIQSFGAIHASNIAVTTPDTQTKGEVETLTKQDELFSVDGARIATALVACCKLLTNTTDELYSRLYLSQLLLASMLLQTNIPLAYRSQKIDYIYPEINSFLNEFSGELLRVVQESEVFPDFYDGYDGRLIHTLFHIQNERMQGVGKPDSTPTFIHLDLPPSLSGAFSLCQQHLKQFVASKAAIDGQIPESVWNLLSRKENCEVEDQSSTVGNSLPKLLPIHNLLIDDYLKDEKFSELKSSVVIEEEDQHTGYAIESWKAKQEVDVKLSQRALKRRKEAQDYSLKRLHDYAESLGKVNEKRAIETDKTEDIPVEEEDTNGKKGGRPAPKKKEPKKPKTSKGAEAIILKNSIKKNSDELESILKQYKTLSVSKISPDNSPGLLRSLEDYVKGVAALLRSSWKIEALVAESNSAPVKGKKAPKPNPEAQAIEKLVRRLEDTLIELFSYELQVCVSVAAQTKSEFDYYKVTEVVNLIYEYLERLSQTRDTSFDAHYKLLISSLNQVGFRKMAEHMLDEHPNLRSSIKIDGDKDIWDPNVLQLKYNYNFRSINQFFPDEPAPVVHMEDLGTKQRAIKEKMVDLGFRPDPWQNELIEHVDRDRSILVSAPTSSGKTFIAFYVIEKILRENDDSVVVFCLPTKALTNQVFAELYSKYAKKYAHPESRQMLGMFTSSDRINVTTSQILITIPQCLEIMLFSHTKEHIEWRERLRYIILDEVHCMSSDGGDVWEHILLMVKCPFLALSATIGNPKEFTQWLSLNKSDVQLVEHKDRPQPLEFQVFQPALEDQPSKLHSIHPLAVLNAYRIVDQEIDRLQTFSAAECLQFFDSANRVCAMMGVENIFEECDPSKLSQDFGLIDRNKLLQYRKLVTSTVQKYARSQAHQELMLSIFADIRKDLDSSFSLMNSHYSKRVFESQHFLKQHFCQLIMSLRQQRQLPAICFYFSRYFIDKLLETLLIYVKANRINLWETDKDRSQALLQIASVCDELTGLVDEMFIEGLKYGISVHYTAIHENYQKAVERLFRQRALPVVIATSTLALGIHMPARTVVIVGKSKYLDTTLFYQCAGRAGRRGFDSLGRVCLYGIDQATINRYMTSAPPNIMGSMGLKPSFLLRMLISYHETLKHSPEKEENVRTDYLRVLQQPLFVLGKIMPQSLHQVKHYFRYSTEFLLRNGYVDPNGTPLNFASFISRMHYHEPYNFMMTFFARNDMLHNLLKDEEIAYEKRLEGLLAVLAYFFGRIKIFKKDVMCRTVAPLPSGISDAYHGYSTLVKQIYSEFVRSYSCAHPQENIDTELPLSKIQFKYVPGETIAGGTLEEEPEEPQEPAEEEINDEDLMWDEDEEEEEKEEIPEPVEVVQEEPATKEEEEPEVDEGEIVRRLKEQRHQNHSTSSFAALSGNNDQYSTVEKLLATVKHTMVIDSSIIPHVSLESEMLNSYAVDFFSHGHIQRLCRDNSFHSANVAKTHLNQVNNDLRNLRNSLDSMNIPEDDILLLAIRDLSTEFSKRFYGYETRRKKRFLKNLAVESSDLDVYGPKATRGDKQYGDKREDMNQPVKKAKENKERRSGKLMQ